MKYSFALFALAAAMAFCVEDGDDWKASTLRPGDVLSISVFRVAEFSKNVRVDEDGMFTYPLCGDIKAEGLTPRTVGKELEKKLTRQIANPHVDVFVESWAPRTVYILGEVNSSMSMELPTYGKMTALQAISAAGGFTESADLNNVCVLRRVGKPGHTKLERIKIDVSALVSKHSGGDDFRLRPEDTIIIPKAPPVYIAGEVNSPGIFNIDTQRAPMCSEMVIRAGGMKDGADAGNIRIVRIGADGKQLLIQASLRSKSLGIYDNDVKIESGDYLLVGTAAQIYVLGEVNTPGPLVLAPDKVITASQAIALAGGFKPTAKQSDVTLIRDKEMRSLNLKKLYSDLENMERDIDLKNGDILFVRESLW